MTKYKMNNTVRSSSEVTLTSYMTGSTDTTNKNQDGQYDTNQNDNVNNEANRNLGGKRCHVCPNSCDFANQTDKLAASLVKQECDKFGLNELKVEGLDKNVCLCEKYNGGCKLCPRPSLAPTLSLNLDGKASCLACHKSSCATVYTSKYLSNFINWLFVKLGYFLINNALNVFIFALHSHCEDQIPLYKHFSEITICLILFLY